MRAAALAARRTTRCGAAAALSATLGAAAAAHWPPLMCDEDEVGADPEQQRGGDGPRGSTIGARAARARERAAAWAAQFIAERPDAGKQSHMVALLGVGVAAGWGRAGSDEQFRDEAFPPSPESLGRPSDDDNRHERRDWSGMVAKMRWNRASEFHRLSSEWGPPCRLFCTPIDPDDIEQGALGNCYFMAALAGLAARGRGEQIRRLFPPEGQHPERGQFTVR